MYQSFVPIEIAEEFVSLYVPVDIVTFRLCSQRSLQFLKGRPVSFIISTNQVIYTQMIRKMIRLQKRARTILYTKRMKT